jgi:hypothetical protein
MVRAFTLNYYLANTLQMVVTMSQIGTGFLFFSLHHVALHTIVWLAVIMTSKFPRLEATQQLLLKANIRSDFSPT